MVDEILLQCNWILLKERRIVNMGHLPMYGGSTHSPWCYMRTVTHLREAMALFIALLEALRESEPHQFY